MSQNLGKRHIANPIVSPDQLVAVKCDRELENGEKCDSEWFQVEPRHRFLMDRLDPNKRRFVVQNGNGYFCVACGEMFVNPADREKRENENESIKPVI